MSHASILGYNRKKFSETEILDGIKTNNDKMIGYIYKNFFPGIKSLVYSFHGLHFDPEDIFQEGLTRAIINVRSNKFNGTSTFYTYLSSICRNVCLKEIQKSVKTTDVDNSSIELEEEMQEDDLIHRLLILKDKMDEACKQIIDLRFGLRKNEAVLTAKAFPNGSMKFEEIARNLNIETDNARQRFKRCFEKLKFALSNDKLWGELSNN